MASKEHKVYTGYYKRYNGENIHVIAVGKDADTDEPVVIFSPVTYSKNRQYFTITRSSFCEQVIVDGESVPKYKRNLTVRVPDFINEDLAEAGFAIPEWKKEKEIDDEYAPWHRPEPVSYHAYAKRLCEHYRTDLEKYRLCNKEKRYIGIQKDDFEFLHTDLLFMKHCLETELKEYEPYFHERFIDGLSTRKYAAAHNLNRGSVDHIQRKFFSALASLLQARDEAEKVSRLYQE